MISISPSEDHLNEQTQALALHWGFNFSTAPKDPFFLQLTPQHLQLVQAGKNSPHPIYVDFTSGQVAHRRQFGGGKGQIIAKAAGLNKTPSPVILDATAGMGKDAFVFASLGARVILMERSPVSAALLSDGLQRAALDENIADIIDRMTLIFGDARFLGSNPSDNSISVSAEGSLPAEGSIPAKDSIQLNERPDVIYLDPMFPHRKKSALVKKEMLAFQSIIGDDKDSNELLNVCRQLAKKRVVVKRPIKASWLNNCKPSFSMNMKKHRFDIYLN